MFKSLAYQLVKRLLHTVPAGVLRSRPFDVYSWKLHPDDAGLREVNIATQPVLQIGWVDNDKVAFLGKVSDEQNIALWSPDRFRAAVAWCNGEPIGVVWVANGSYHEVDLGIEFALREHEAWLFAAHVLEKHRRQRVYSKLLQFIAVELHRVGVTHVLFGVSWGNSISERAHSSLGAPRVGSILVLRLCGAITLAWTWGKVLRRAKWPWKIGRQPIQLAHKAHTSA